MDDVRKANLVRGKTIRFTWTEGPTKGETHEHIFHEDGAVEYARLDAGKPKGSYTKEKQYAALRISDDVHLVSYLAASGFTLTVALNFRDHPSPASPRTTSNGFSAPEPSRSSDRLASSRRGPAS